MLAEVLTIGDELCRGEIIDTNSAWLAAALWDLDIITAHLSSCRDIDADIEAALATACGRADVVLVSGGLGPTDDDRTVDVVSKLVGSEPAIEPRARARLEERAAKTGFSASNLFRQVRIPGGARVHENPAGLAPGFEVAGGKARIFCFPGIPRELHAIWKGSVVDRLAELREGGAKPPVRLAKRIYRVFGRGESQVADAVDRVADGVDGASVHFQVKFPETLVKVVCRSPDQAGADAALASLDDAVRGRLGRHCYGFDDDSLAAATGRVLRAAGATVATAESCTGGLVGGLFTDVPGSSDYYVGGIIAYHNREKVARLGVAEGTLDEHGAVSEPTVVEMARGVRARLGVRYGVAVSGVAGPGGGTPNKPVGTVWLAVCGPNAEKTRKLAWPGARDQVRMLSAHAAVELVRRMAMEDHNHGR